MLDEVAGNVAAARETLAVWQDRLSANKREADQLDRTARQLRDEPEALARVLDRALRLRARHLRQATAAARSVRSLLGVVVPPDGWGAGSEFVAGTSAQVSLWTGELAAISQPATGTERLATTVTAGAVDRVSPAEPPGQQAGGRPLPVAGLPVAGLPVVSSPVARAPAGSRPPALPLATAPLLGTTTTAGTRRPTRTTRSAGAGRAPSPDRTDRADRSGRGTPEHHVRPTPAAHPEPVARANRTGRPEYESAGRTGGAENGARANRYEPSRVATPGPAAPGTGQTVRQSDLPPTEPRPAPPPPEPPARSGAASPDPGRPVLADPGPRVTGPSPVPPGSPVGTPTTVSSTASSTSGSGGGSSGPANQGANPNHDQEAESDLGVTAMMLGAAAGCVTHGGDTARFGRLRGFLLKHAAEHSGDRPILAFFLVRQTDDGRLHRRSLFLTALAPPCDALDSPRSTGTPAAVDPGLLTTSERNANG